MTYKPSKIEPKWQKYWEDNKLNAADDKDTKKPKFYCLDMFPYPSGAGLHVGHVESYTATDIYSRFMRMNGYNVLHPQGWDAFGLPAENYAIKTKIHPKITTEKALANFKRQIKSLGFSYDWSREIKTSDPAYCKWTQWLFIKLYENGLAYQKKAPVNWCESCQTVLAREQVIDGKCERCGKTVIQKNLTQWFFRITDYAEKLLNGLKNLNWPESIKLMQENWIGKSEGAEIDFNIKTEKIDLGKKHSSKKIDKMFEVIDQINSALSKENIKVWFNGTFGVAGYYGCVFDDPRDVDCGVLVKDFNNARKLIENLGYKKIKDKENPKFKVSIYNAGDFDLEIGTFDHDLGDKIVEPEGYEFRVPEPKSFAEGYTITAPKKRRIGKNDALRAIFLKSISDDNKIRIFTTRPDTIFGATYLVLAPEHELVTKLKSKIENLKDIENYIDKTKKKTELERTSLEKIKTGVELKGIKAINPATKKEIPVYIADYVLTTYGTGAIMAVPAHDERDFEFAKKYDLPVKYVVASYIKTDAKPNAKTIKRKMIHAIVLDQNNEKVLCLKWKKEGWGSIIVGGIDNEENALEAAKREIRQESGYTDFEFLKELPGEIHAEYFSSHKKENRYAIIKTLIFKLKNSNVVERAEEDINNNTKIYWIERSKVADFLSNSPAQVISWRKYQNKIDYILDDGISINSDFINDMPTNIAKNKIVEWLENEKIGKLTVNYRLRDWLVSRQRYWGAPIPIIYCDKCGIVPVPEKDLPVKLPDDVDFKPTGESPLVRSKKFNDVKCPKCGSPARRESDTMDTFVCSSWYYLRYADPKNEKQIANRQLLKKWLPVDLYIGGKEHATGHLIFSRFMTKVLKDLNYIGFDEPFTKLNNQGMIIASDGRKMSKSLGNVINPDDVVNEYGADSLRMYEMFMGPLEDQKPWDTKGIVGIKRFLDRVWNLNDKVNYESRIKNNELEKSVQNTIKKISENIQSLKFNTAISAMMILSNSFIKEKEISIIHYSLFIILLSPFAPHIAEELWSNIGHKESIFKEKWPKATKIKVDRIKVAVQINGKVRGIIETSPDSTEKEILVLAQKEKNIAKYLENVSIEKSIYISGKILSIVI
jgi:leucyl-tRNA synthetase